MAADFSWERTAAEYQRVYEQVIGAEDAEGVK
jgi:glycogen synthase